MINGNKPNEKPKRGEIRLYDNQVPTLQPGDYTISYSQRVNPKNQGEHPIDETYSKSQQFCVQGPRYTLPAGDVFSLFPPDNAQGAFGQHLPHVVFSKKDLPWERNIFGDDTTENEHPWMALMLFTEGETIDGSEPLLNPDVPDWKSNRNKTANIQANQFFHDHSGTDILWPKLSQEWYETDEYLKQTSCAVIDVSAAGFQTLVPAPDELRYLSHARQVNPSDKDSQVLNICGDGWYSVLVSKRLPFVPTENSKTPRRNIVHLVSLEGLQDHVGKSLPLNVKRVRMISLKNWSFTCAAAAKESFSDLANGLLKDVKGNEKRTEFVLPITQPEVIVAETDYATQAVQNGYVPMRYQTRVGEQTFAWFRGPFSPNPVKNFFNHHKLAKDNSLDRPGFDTASAAMIYDKEKGIFDASYATAWETGRLSALSDKLFGQQLLEWQRKGHHLVDLMLERRHQLNHLNSLNGKNEEKHPSDMLDPYAATDEFMGHFITRMSANMIPTPKQNAMDNHRPIAYADTEPPTATPQNIRNLLKDSRVLESIRKQGDPEAEAIVDWLSKLYLLHGVPFETLVPHGDLLPSESIRFFYVDSNWLDALLEGALSIGAESSRDRLYHKTMKDLLWTGTHKKAQSVRTNELTSFADDMASNEGFPFECETMSGMLLRSSLVSGWPGLSVCGFEKTKTGSAEPDLSSLIPLLRMERLSKDVLLCLWPKVPTVVTVDEPHEGIAFGFEDPKHGKGDVLYLRSLEEKNYGEPLSGDEYIVDAKDVIDSQRQISIAGESGLLTTIQNKLPNTPVLDVRDFAIEMVKVPERIIFAASPSKGEDHDR